MFRKTKVRLYVVIIRPTLMYRSEAWMTTKKTERNLKTFENIVWRKYVGPSLMKQRGTGGGYTTESCTI